MFQEKLDRNQNADDLAITLWVRSRGKSNDDLLDGPIIYPAELRFPRGVCCRFFEHLLAVLWASVV